MRYTLAQCRQLVTCSVDYQLIVGKMYKLAVDGILCRCALEHERGPIFYKAHEGIAGGHTANNSTVQFFFIQGFGGPHSSLMQMNTINVAMYVNGSESLVEDMRSLCFWLQYWNHLRSVKLILLA
jgi:hypothetical protein